MKPVRPSLARHLARLTREQQGISSVEFAMLLPLMLTLYLGAVEISQAVGIDRKVTLTSRTVADLASQVTSISNNDMSNLLNASSSVIAPYDASKLKVTVSEVSVDANGNATVTWSDTLGGTARAVGSSVALPAALSIANTSVIWGEASYNYRPAIGWVITGTLQMYDQIFLRPRQSTSVTHT